MKKRHFTRKDVEEYVTRVWGKSSDGQDEPDFVVGDIELLEETLAPVWLVAFTIHTVRISVLITQNFLRHADNSKEYYLTPLKTHKLPIGCKTVWEEDQAIKNRSNPS